MANLKLGIPGLNYENLFDVDGLQKVDAAFFAHLKQKDTALSDGLLAYRNRTREFSGQETSELLINCGRELESFMGTLFGISQELDSLRDETVANDPVFQFKKNYVLRKARRRLLKNDVEETFAELDNWLTKSLKQDRQTGPALFNRQRNIRSRNRAADPLVHTGHDHARWQTSGKRLGQL